MNEGRVQLRSNIAIDGEAWHLVPGDALHHYAPYRLKAPHQPTRRQLDERTYYVACSICGRRINEIELQGCTDCAHGPTRAAQEVAVARHENAEREIAKLRAALDSKGRS